jgi:hypothetical protein
MLVGNEVLPNVYIDNVLIYDKKVLFDVFVLDSIEAPTWSDRMHLKDKLKIKIHCIDNDPAAASLIINGEPIDQTSIDTHLYNVFDFSSFNVENGTFSGHKMFRMTYVKTFESKPSDLSVFAGLFLDNTNGPVTSETIIVNDQVNQSTKTFMKGSNQYYGAVHLHEGEYMEGAKHSDVPHSKLRLVSLPNLKIKDYSTYVYNNKKQEKGAQVPYFSNLINSFDENTKHNFMLFLNIEEILLTKTKYGKLLKMSGRETINKIINNLRIRSIKVDRKKVKCYFKPLIGGSKKKKPLRTIETANVLRAFESSKRNLKNTSGEKIQFISHKFGHPIYGFHFEDTVDDHTFGDFQYTFEFSFIDPTIKFLRDSFIQLKNTIGKSKRLRNILSLPGNYNHKTKKPTENFANSPLIEDGLDVSMPEILNNAKRFLFEMTEQQSRQFLFRMFNLLNYKTCSLESIDKFIAEASQTLNRYMALFNLSDNLIKGNYDKKSDASLRSANNRITIQHSFNEIITPSNSKFHYSFNRQEIKNNIKPSPKLNKVVSFGSRNFKHNFIFSNPKVTNKAFNNILSRANLSIKPQNFISVNILQNLPANVSIESYTDSSEYLGRDSKFESAEPRDKCEIAKQSEDLEKIISLGVQAGNYNLNKVAIDSLEKNLELLDGFETNKDGKIMVNKLKWRKYSFESITGTAILKQVQNKRLREDLSFPYTNEFVLLNNSPTELLQEAIDEHSVLMHAANKVSPYDPSLTAGEVVTNSNVMTTSDYVGNSFNTTRTFDSVTQPTAQSSTMSIVTTNRGTGY